MEEPYREGEQRLRPGLGRGIMEWPHIGLFALLLPACLSSLGCDLAALFLGHGLETAFARRDPIAKLMAAVLDCGLWGWLHYKRRVGLGGADACPCRWPWHPHDAT